MKILIIEAYTDANIGSAALIENAVKILKQKYPDSTIKIQAHNPEAVYEFIKLKTYHEIFQLPYLQPRLKQLLWLSGNVLWMLIHFFIRILRLPIPERLYTWNKKRLESLKAIKNSDICVSIGAERINDNFFMGLSFSLYSLWVVKNYGKKLILFPQTIGPFHFRISKYFARKILNICNYVYLRDIRSKDIMQAIGVRNNYSFVPDIAMLQEPVGQERISSIYYTEKINSQGRNIAGISALKWSYFKAEKDASNYDDYKRIVAQTADYLIENKGYHVVFVPTNLKIHGCREDDADTAKEIYELIKNKENVSLISSLYTPAEIKGLFSTMDLFIATRMHACILATSAYTPTLAINYQFKLYEYMKLLGLENNSVDIEALSYDKVKELIDFTFENRDKIKKQLKERISSLKPLILEGINNSLEEVVKL